ncbi:small metal-binding protein [Sulfolobus acidocaldarius SUSAZ]|nr:small metal-binding protein [Sulfolobus acidocaldarius SUSAZ]
MVKYTFKCADVGMDCGFEIVNAGSEDELLEELKSHAKMSHGLTSISSDLLNKIKQNIKKSGKYYFACSNVGMDCGFEIKASSSEQELLEELMVHAKMSHGLTSIPQETLNKIKQNIKVM